MPQKGRYYKVGRIPETTKSWYNLKDTVRAGTIVKCLENYQIKGFDHTRIAVQLSDGSVRYVCALQLENPVLKKGGENDRPKKI